MMLLMKGQDIHISVQWRICFNQEVALAAQRSRIVPSHTHLLLKGGWSRSIVWAVQSQSSQVGELHQHTQKGATAPHPSELAFCRLYPRAHQPLRNTLEKESVLR